MARSSWGRVRLSPRSHSSARSLLTYGALDIDAIENQNEPLALESVELTLGLGWRLKEMVWQTGRTS